MLYAIASFEHLEDRRLLSAAATAMAGAQPAAPDATGTFSGVINFPRADELGRRSGVLTLDVASQDAAGGIAGTLDSASLGGSATFTGGQVGTGKRSVPLSLDFAGDQSGSLTAKLNPRNPNVLVGAVTDAAGKRMGTFRLFRFNDVAVTTAPAAAAATTTDGATANTNATTAANTGGTPDTGTTATTPPAPTQPAATIVVGPNVGTIPVGTAGIASVQTPTTTTSTTTTSTAQPTTTTSASGTLDASANANANIIQIPLFGPGSVGGGVPDGSVVVTSGSPDISVAGGGGVGSGIDITAGVAAATLNGPSVNAPDGSVAITSGIPDISTATGGGAGSGLDISTGAVSVNGLPINAPTTVVDTSSSAAPVATTPTIATASLFNTGSLITGSTGAMPSIFITTG